MLLFELLFLSWFRPDGGNQVTSHTRNQHTFCQLWAFLITLEGATKLLNDIRVFKMFEPVDVAYWSAHVRGTVRNLMAYPPLCLTVGARSDTNGQSLINRNPFVRKKKLN